MWAALVFLLFPAVTILIMLYWKIQGDKRDIRTKMPTTCPKCGSDLLDDHLKECTVCGTSMLTDQNWTVMYHEPRTEKEMFWYGIMFLIFGGVFYRYGDGSFQLGDLNG